MSNTKVAIVSLQRALEYINSPDNELAGPHCPQGFERHMANAARLGYLRGTVETVLKQLTEEAQS